MAEINNLPNNEADSKQAPLVAAPQNPAPPGAAPPPAPPAAAPPAASAPQNAAPPADAPPAAAPPAAAPPAAAPPEAAPPAAGPPAAAPPAAGPPAAAPPAAGPVVAPPAAAPVATGANAGNAALGDEPADKGECPDPKGMMSKACPPTWMILVLAAYAFVGTSLLLLVIRDEWCKATPGPKSDAASTGKATPAAPTGQKGASTGIGAASGTAGSSGNTGSSGQIAASGPTGPTSPSGVAGATATGTGSTGSSGSGASISKEDKGCTECPTEESILWMIILLGALGGFIHLCASLAQFVGNRALRTSWVLYYVFMPLEGAALAPLMFLLLRVGVLNMNAAAQAASQGQCATANLNLMGLYAFAGLTGLFSKQAIEKLATVFSKVNASDSIPPSNKQTPAGPDNKAGK
jgi:hypothetical protein